MQEAGVQLKLGKDLLETGQFHFHLVDGLALHPVPVVFQGHRGRTHIAVGFQGLLGGSSALFAQGVKHLHGQLVAAAHQVPGPGKQEILILEISDQGLHQLGGNPEIQGHLPDGEGVPVVGMLE